MSGGNWKELYQAARKGDLELVRYHVEAGVDVNYAHPEFQCTPLVGAILARQEPVALYLLDHGADPHLRSDFDDATPAQAADEVRLARVAERLRSLGATA